MAAASAPRRFLATRLDLRGFRRLSPIPALVIAGWADGYRNTPLKAVEGLGDKAKALIGPWVHKYPHFAWPKPRADFHGEAIAWWNRWLRDDGTGVESAAAGARLYSRRP